MKEFLLAQSQENVLNHGGNQGEESAALMLNQHMDMKRSTPGPTTRINSAPIAAVKDSAEGSHLEQRQSSNPDSLQPLTGLAKKDQTRSLEGDSKQSQVMNERQRVHSLVSFKEPMPMQENN